MVLFLYVRTHVGSVNTVVNERPQEIKYFYHYANLTYGSIMIMNIVSPENFPEMGTLENSRVLLLLYFGAAVWLFPMNLFRNIGRKKPKVPLLFAFEFLTSQLSHEKKGISKTERLCSILGER